MKPFLTTVALSYKTLNLSFRYILHTSLNKQSSTTLKLIAHQFFFFCNYIILIAEFVFHTGSVYMYLVVVVAVSFCQNARGVHTSAGRKFATRRDNRQPMERQWLWLPLAEVSGSESLFLGWLPRTFSVRSASSIQPRWSTIAGVSIESDRRLQSLGGSKTTLYKLL